MRSIALILPYLRGGSGAAVGNITFVRRRFGLQQILHFKGIFSQIEMPRLTRGLLEPIELVTIIPYHLYIDCRIVSVCFGNGAKQ